jgi:hypothetical protein
MAVTSADISRRSLESCRLSGSGISLPRLDGSVGAKAASVTRTRKISCVKEFPVEDHEMFFNQQEIFAALVWISLCENEVSWTQ